MLDFLKGGIRFPGVVRFLIAYPFIESVGNTDQLFKAGRIWQARRVVKAVDEFKGAIKVSLSTPGIAELGTGRVGKRANGIALATRLATRQKETQEQDNR
jgi:hypothetical protein